jgi:glyoxylase-like metal-dependent hydrolase (beta-lactamase superfamily II)
MDVDVVPFLARLGLTPRNLDIVIVTHGHPDHVGGIAALRVLNPDIEIVCSETDRPWVEDHGRMYNELFCRFPGDLDLEDEVRTYVMHELCGPDVRVDRVVGDGDTIDLGSCILRIVASPGHSLGHLSVFEERSATLLVGDASQGRGIGHTATSKSLPPLYEDASLYVQTQDVLAALDARTLVSSHHEVTRGAAVSDFLRLSARFAERNGEIVSEIVDRAKKPVTLGQTALELGGRLDQLEAECYEGPLQLLSVARTHLDQLAAAGLVVREGNAWLSV